MPLNHLVILQVRRRLAAGPRGAGELHVAEEHLRASVLDFHLPLLYLEQNSVPHAIQTLWSL